MGVVEHAAAAADAGTAVTGDVPCEAEASRNVVQVRLRAVLGHARIAAEEQSRRRVAVLGRPDALVVRVHVEDLEASDQIVPGTDWLIARAKIHRDAIVELEVVLEVVSLIEVSIVLVLTRSVIEAAKPPEQEVGERISAAGRAWRTGVLAVRDEVHRHGGNRCRSRTAGTRARSRTGTRGVP